MSILERVKATWFLSKINLIKGGRNILCISYIDSNKNTLLHSCECQDKLYGNMIFEGKYNSSQLGQDLWRDFLYGHHDDITDMALRHNFLSLDAYTKLPY